MARDALLEELEDAALVFGEDTDSLWLMLNNESTPVFECSLINMVADILDIVRTKAERNHMRKLASHFDCLADHIREALDEDEMESS